jgi:hypothetical protein
MIVGLEANDFDRSLEAPVALVVVDRFWASFVESIFLEKQKPILISLLTYIYHNKVLVLILLVNLNIILLLNRDVLKGPH